MATAAQITANRANAQKSTGPRTPEGKQNSRAAVTRHGLRVSDAVLRQEQPDEYGRLLAGYTAEFSPKPDSTEEELVRQLTFATLRLHRIDKAELSHLQQFAPEPATTLEGCTEQIGAMYLADTTGPRHLALLDRYRGSAERSFWRSLKALQAAQPRYTARTPPAKLELLRSPHHNHPEPNEPNPPIPVHHATEPDEAPQPKNPIPTLLLLLCLVLLFSARPLTAQPKNPSSTTESASQSIYKQPKPISPSNVAAHPASGHTVQQSLAGV